MDRQKCLLIPVLMCAFTFVIFFFQMGEKTTWNFFSIYNIRFVKNFSSPPYMRMLHSNIHTNVSIKDANKNESIPQHFTNPWTSFHSSSTASSVKTLHASSQQTFRKTTMTSIEFTSLRNDSKTTFIPMDTGNATYYLCPNFLGGLGNLLFIFATHFGASMAKGMTIAMTNNTELDRVFKLNVFTENTSRVCQNVVGRSARWDCAYDENLMKFNASKNIRLNTYMQSWKYFYDYRDSLRKELVFRPHVQLEANKMLNKELDALKIKSRKDVILIGVHIRRGDMVNHSFGYNVATPEYLSKAVQYYKNKYKNTIFIVSSLDMEWTQNHFPKNETVRYINHKQREIIVALLSACDHTITTVGSFGWWIGWLTGGDVTYFKWPAKEGSKLRKHFSKDFSDYFYPGWVGL